MKYMCVWSIPPETHEAVVKRFKEQSKKGGYKPPAGVKLLGRWHELGTGKGYSLYEADDPVALSKALLPGSTVADQKVVPVVDDEEITKAISEADSF